jgi:hypothetical protein
VLEVGKGMHMYYMNAFGILGLREAADAARSLGYVEDDKLFAGQAAELKASLHKSFAKTFKRTGLYDGHLWFGVEPEALSALVEAVRASTNGAGRIVVVTASAGGDAVEVFVKKMGGRVPPAVRVRIEEIGRQGATPLVVGTDGRPVTKLGSFLLPWETDGCGGDQHDCQGLGDRTEEEEVCRGAHRGTMRPER